MIKKLLLTLSFIILITISFSITTYAAEEGKKIVVSEVMKRKLNCNFFPELASKEPWMEDWIKEYEESLEQ